METNAGKGDREPMIVSGTLHLCGEPLTEPLLEFQFAIPMSIMLPNGTTITFPPGVSVYVSPFEVATSLGQGIQRLIAETQKEEELRWSRATA